MLQKSVIDKVISTSPLLSQSHLSNNGPSRRKRTLAAALILTSLVDVFSILIAYLLVATSTNTSGLYNQGIQLPSATKSDLTRESLVVTLNSNGDIIIDERMIPRASAETFLSDWIQRRKESHPDQYDVITIIADKNTAFESISPIVGLAAKTGFVHFQLAVINNDDPNPAGGGNG